jgi:hypothetical protein
MESVRERSLLQDAACGPALDTVVGEVIAVATTSFEAQSYRLNEAPPFGSLVLTSGPDGLGHFGLCYGTETGGIEPGRHPIAWGRPDDVDGDVYARQPQLAHVLRTTFQCALVGFRDADGVPVQRVPARPPRVHERVCTAPDAQVRAFFVDVAYMRFLLRASVPNVEDLLAASIVHGYHAMGDDRRFLVQAGRAVARLLATDHERLTAVLELLAAALEA